MIYCGCQYNPNNTPKTQIANGVNLSAPDRMVPTVPCGPVECVFEKLCMHFCVTIRGGLIIWKLGHCPRARGQ
ncbi:unnamed protein product [Staurois parvus]|uniref:Uncharacterized protein n=1 Tax=Staurois parvus TaxID=386267 RepID=A0ABN9CK10_9NEOB|nr:unnamed protein product [Staurois parvus]